MCSMLSLSHARNSNTPQQERRQSDKRAIDYVSKGSNADTCGGFADILAGCLHGEYQASNPTRRLVVAVCSRLCKITEVGVWRHRQRVVGRVREKAVLKSFAVRKEPTSTFFVE